MLTRIRQEASELQDQGQGKALTMRACLTDTFDNSEFASIRVDVAAFSAPSDACGHAGWDPGDSRPRALSSYNLTYAPSSGPQRARYAISGYCVAPWGQE